ncbi:MAG TPA: MBL fold metallo-hydrolase [Solirubrobacteraceae bacterium]|jgi:glyoxylase-like metal-dependent hydrolase (beta-lactamase superfamily II)|nr:MBL fold metallo-hydrolase [Solirubrobacteraceae bacterium]
MSEPAQLIDLCHLGRPRVVGAWRVGDVLVDPGPASCLEKLEATLEGWRPRALALTHIHLDHAGATGSLVARWPEVEVWVHAVGAPHLVDPTRLLASATRLYGEDMDRLWGEVLAVPEERIRRLRGGERLGRFEVAYSPGHASHHVTYLDTETRVAYVGDVAGVRIAPAQFVLAPTPPPDIDLPVWLQSLDELEHWGPRELATTHFGLVSDVSEHLQALRARMQEWAELARECSQERFVASVRQRIAQATDPQTAACYEHAAPQDQLWLGLRRYWERR